MLQLQHFEKELKNISNNDSMEFKTLVSFSGSSYNTFSRKLVRFEWKIYCDSVKKLNLQGYFI